MTHKYPDMRIAVFAGSFNPFTVGHLSVLKRGLELFDRVVVVIGVNDAKQPVEDEYVVRVETLRSQLATLERVEVMAWSGLTVDAAKSVGARWLLRGVRSVADFEYERNLADVNRVISGIETVLLFSEPDVAMVSSSMVRELQRYGYDVSRFVPPEQDKVN